MNVTATSFSYTSLRRGSNVIVMCGMSRSEGEGGFLTREGNLFAFFVVLGNLLKMLAPTKKMLNILDASFLLSLQYAFCPETISYAERMHLFTTPRQKELRASFHLRNAEKNHFLSYGNPMTTSRHTVCLPERIRFSQRCSVNKL